MNIHELKNLIQEGNYNYNKNIILNNELFANVKNCPVIETAC